MPFCEWLRLIGHAWVRVVLAAVLGAMIALQLIGSDSVQAMPVFSQNVAYIFDVELFPVSPGAG